MQGIKVLRDQLTELSDQNHYLFSLSDLSSLFPSYSMNNLKTLISRSCRSGLLIRVCRGIYMAPRIAQDGLLLFHTAVKIRAGHFNYISLETALSDEGLISQIPMNRITIMSSGRKSQVDCGEFGSIEFIHTRKKVSAVADRLNYDVSCGMWRADSYLALADLKAVGRNLDLVTGKDV